MFYTDLVLNVGSKPMLFEFKCPKYTNLIGKKGTYEINASISVPVEIQ